MSTATHVTLKMVSQSKQTEYIPYFRPKWQNLYPISDKKCLKMTPFRAAHTHMAYIWEYPPPPPPPGLLDCPTFKIAIFNSIRLNLRHHSLFSVSSPNTSYHECFGTFYRLKRRQMWQSRSHCSSRPCCREKPRRIKQRGRPLHSSGARRNLRAASASLPVNSLSPCCIQWSYQLFGKLSNNKVIIWIIIIITIALRLECFSWGTSTNKDIHLIKSYKSQQYISFI